MNGNQLMGGRALSRRVEWVKWVKRVVETGNVDYFWQI